MDTGGSLLEEGINQQTLNELLGLADELEYKDIPYSPPLDLNFPSFPSSSSLPNDSLNDPTPGAFLQSQPSLTTSSRNAAPLQSLPAQRPLQARQSQFVQSAVQSTVPSTGNVQLQNENVQELARQVAVSGGQLSSGQFNALPCIVPSGQNVTQLVQSNAGSAANGQLLQQGQLQSQILGQGQLQGQFMGQGQVLQQTILASGLRQTPSPILTLNAPRSNSPLIIRPQQILPKTAQPAAGQPSLQPATLLPAASQQNLILNRAPSPQLVTTAGAPAAAALRNAFVQPGGRIVLPPGVRLQGQPFVFNAAQRTVNINPNNVLNTNVLNALQNQLQPATILQGNLQGAQFLQNPPTGTASNPQQTQFQTGRTMVPNQGAVAFQGNQLLTNQALGQNAQVLDNLSTFPNLNVNASGNSVNLLNLNAQPGSQIVIHGQIPTSSQGGIILGPVLTMNSDGQNGQKIFLNNSGVPLQGGDMAQQNFVLNVGASGLNLQNTSVQQIRPMSQAPAQKPMANVVGQRQVDPVNRSQSDDIMSKAMSMSAIEIDDDDDIGTMKAQTSSQVRREPVAQTSGLGTSQQRSHQTEMPSASQAGLAVDSKIQSVIPLSPQIQNALQKVQAEIKNLRSLPSLDDQQQIRLEKLLQVQSKIIQHARDQATKQAPAANTGVQSSQISQSNCPPANTSIQNPSDFQGAFVRQIRASAPPPNVTVKSEPRIGEVRPVLRRPVAAIAPMQPRQVANVQPVNRNIQPIQPSQQQQTAAVAKEGASPAVNLATLLNAPTTTPPRLAPLNIATQAVGATVAAVANTTTNSVPLSTSIGGMTRIGIVKASDISSPTGCVPESRPSLAPAPAPQGPVPTHIKVGTHVLNMTLTPDQKRTLEAQLSRLTPQQQEAVFTHQQLLLARSQKIQLKATAVGPNNKPLVLPGQSEGVQAAVVSSNPLTLKLLNQPISSAQPMPVKTGPPGPPSTAAPTLVGAKRPAPRTLPQSTVPSKVAMVRQQLDNDRRAMVECREKNRPFSSWLDVCRRLTPYHVTTELDIPARVLYNDDVRTEEEASVLINKSRFLMEQFRKSLLLSSMKEPMAPERVMMEKLFIEDEKEQLRKDRDLAMRHPELFNPRPKLVTVKSEIIDPMVYDIGEESPDADTPNVKQKREWIKSGEPVKPEPKSDRLNTNLQLSPVSSSGSTHFDIPSVGWAASPSEAKAPLKLVLRKSALGFQNVSSPMPPPSDDEEEGEEEGEEVEEEEDQSMESVVDEEEEEAEEGSEIAEADETVENCSESTEVERSTPVNDDDSTRLSSQYTSEFQRQISLGMEAISDDDDEPTQTLPEPPTFGDFMSGDPYLEEDMDFVPEVDLGDQMQNAIESILSLQQPTDVPLLASRQNSLASELNGALPSNDDLDAAVQSILF